MKMKEQEYGDIYFKREVKDGEKTIVSEQFMHVPTIHEVESAIRDAGFEVVEVNDKLQISKDDIRESPPVFYVCQK